MRKLILFIIVTTLLLAISSQAQNLTQEQKDSIIAELYSDQWGKVFRATTSIEYYKIYKAIPVLQNNIWNKDINSRFFYVEAMYGLNMEGAAGYANALFDTLDNNVYAEIDSVEFKLLLIRFLFDFNDYSKIDYLYYNTETPRGKLDNTLTIDLWNQLLYVPEYELAAKEKLIMLMKESVNGDERVRALYWLGDKYKEEIAPIVLNRFIEDDDFTIKWTILHEYFPYGDFNIVSNLVKEGLNNEYDPPIQRQLLKYLLDSLRTPSNYNFALEWLNNGSGDPKFKKGMKIYERYLSPGKPYIPDSFSDIVVIIDSTISYVNQLEGYGWIGDSYFSNSLKSTLNTAKTNLLAGDSLACRENIKSFQDLVDNVYKDSLLADPRFVTIEGWKFLYWNAQYILDRLPNSEAFKKE